jgi:hypothetical protein
MALQDQKMWAKETNWFEAKFILCTVFVLDCSKEIMYELLLS